MAVSRAAWLHALHDSSSNSSSRRPWKGAGVVMSPAWAFQVSGKIARRGERRVTNHIRSRLIIFLFIIPLNLSFATVHSWNLNGRKFTVRSGKSWMGILVRDLYLRFWSSWWGFVGINTGLLSRWIQLFILITAPGRQGGFSLKNEWLICFSRWIHLSIHAGVFIGMSDELVFAIDTPCRFMVGFS